MSNVITADLKFNLREISNMRQKLSDTENELNTLKNQILQEIEQLKQTWKTPAGRKFMNEVDVDWAKNVDKYVKILEGVNELLKVAETSYNNVLEESKRISI